MRQNQIIVEDFARFLRLLEALARFARQIQTSGPANVEELLVLTAPQTELQIEHFASAQRLEGELVHARAVSLELRISNEFQLIAETLESHLERFQEVHLLEENHLRTFRNDLIKINDKIRNLQRQRQPEE